jgi:hypothetical protein
MLIKEKDRQRAREYIANTPEQIQAPLSIVLKWSSI